MLNQAIRSALIAAGVAFALFLISTRAAAQASASNSAVLALVDSLPVPAVPAVVMFRSRPSGRHIVAIRRDRATPELLGGALALVRRLERAHAGDARSAIVPISASARTRALPASARAPLQSLIERAERRPMTRIGDLGQGRWLRIDQPLSGLR